MTHDPKDVDAVARAICQRQGFGYYTDPMEGGQDAYDICREADDEAVAALNALTARGWQKVPDGSVVVPREPTNEMLAEYLCASDVILGWTQMLAAAPKPEDGA